MYKLQPLFKSVVETPHPNCVYKMKKISDHFNHNIAANDGSGENTQNDATSNNCEVEELEKRWTEITSRLQRLQSELAAIKTGSASGLSSFVDAGVQNFQDLVIQASPSNPPHSLPLLKQQLEMLGMTVYARTHVHSTMAGNKLLDDTLKNFICSDSRVERSRARVAITLIWIKGDGEEPSLMVSPSSQAVPIKGEANIARYLARMVPGLLDYESQPLKAAQIDHYLDLTECSAPLGVRGLKRERAATLKLLDTTLSTKKSLEGSQVGVVDFVVYSALVNSCTEKEIGTNIHAWMDRCRSTVKKANATSPSDMKRSNLEKYLLELGIAFRTVEHPAVFTVAAMMEHISHLVGFHAKNLFVKDKKTNKLYLITARHDATVQLGQISKVIGAKELRFADVETLEANLGVQQGSVTPFALLNDAQEHRVTFVLDGQLWNEKNSDGQDTYLNFHPMTNEATTSITVAEFKLFLKATGHEPVIIQL